MIYSTTKIRNTLTLILIPAIDLAQGRVVHAYRGQRDEYQPLRSRLCRSCEPSDVIAGLLGLHAFTTLYIADLDALQDKGDQSTVIKQIRDRFPDLELWIDAGIHTLPRCRRWRQGAPRTTAVLGSETLSDTALLQNKRVTECDTVLSLDFKGNRLLGPADLLERPEHWPTRIIAMCLDQVGSAQGPDTERLRQLERKSPHSELFAAGGVRDLDDLLQLRQLGVVGALLASALHDGRIDAAHITALARSSAEKSS